MNNGRSKNSKNRKKKGAKEINLTLTSVNCRSIYNKKVSVSLELPQPRPLSPHSLPFEDSGHPLA
jgi:hypothetical protein